MSGEYLNDMSVYAKNFFKDLDVNKDGYVTFDEFQRVNTILPEMKNKNELKKLFDEADLNKDGKLTLDGI